MPEEMVVHILSRLPPKSLMRYKCVHKSWYALVNNPTFVANHLHWYNKSSCISVLMKRSVITRTEGIPETIVFSFLSLHDDSDGHEGNLHATVEDLNFPASLGLKTRGQFIDLPMPYHRQSDETVYIVGHCDGLTCLLICSSKNLVLWNPEIKQFRILSGFISSNDAFVDTLAFGSDPKSKDYVVVNIISTIEEPCYSEESERFVVHRPKTKLYTLGTDSWREIKTANLETETTIFCPTVFQVYYKGVFYWSGDEENKERCHCFYYYEDETKRYRPVIILFDTADELFHNRLLPDCFYKPDPSYRMHLAVWNESIALFAIDWIDQYNQSFEIWVMEEVGGECSWIKHVEIMPRIKLYMPGVLWKNNSVLMMTADGRLVSYNFVMEKATYLPIHGKFLAHNESIVCAKSIVSVTDM